MFRNAVTNFVEAETGFSDLSKEVASVGVVIAEKVIWKREFYLSMAI